MNKTINRIKSLLLGGAITVSALAAPLSTYTVTPSLTANAADTDDYARLLQYSLYFYDANMCGNEVKTKGAMSWRGNCHTSDEVQGGFHDAGDHAMFGLPQGYAASVLGWSYYEFKDAYDSTGQGDHLKVITDHFCDFFKRSTKLNGNSVSSFLYQKGDGTEDHSYWGAPEQQGSRKMFWTSNSASDMAANYAAALALNYINFGDAEDLKYAEALYNFSTQHNTIERNGPTGFYVTNDPSPQDEQANAAGWLYIATKNEKYKSDCASKQTQYLGWCDGWDNRGLGAACVYAEITGDWSKVNSYLGGLCNSSSYLCMDDWGSARYNCSVQMSALIASKHSNADYTSWCKGQMTYILGQNPFNTCFVTGFSSNSAKNTHHRAASGYQGYEGSDGMNEYTTTYHPTKGHVLIGALAGGPTGGGQYSDVMNDYKTNEVAIDYNAGLVGAAAGLYSVYKTGKTASSIEGVTKIYSGSPVVNPPVTTTTTKKGQPIVTTTTVKPGPSNKDIVLMPDDMTVGTEEGDDGEMNNYAEFSPQGAKSATLYYKVNSNDTNTSGAFGTWTGKWEQEDFDSIAVPADKIVSVDYDIPSNVGSTVKAMVFWPHGNNVTIQKVVLHMENTPVITTTTTRTTTTSRTTTTVKPGPSNKDIVLMPDDMTVGTEEGDDGEMNNYAEFRPQGAKSATLYYKVNSNDMNTSGAFGTWTGKWEQEDFDGIAVPADKIVAVDYDIPSNVGSTVKAMVFWPHGNNVTIQKVVLHMDNTPVVTTTTTKNPTTTTTTVTPPGTKTPGDANCDGNVRLNDAILVLQAIGNPEKYGINGSDPTHITYEGMLNADVDSTGDGLTSTDALTIQRYTLHLISKL